MFRLQGGEWVAREIVRDVTSGRARFVVSTGDVVWWGNQGRTINDSPYWKRVNETTNYLTIPGKYDYRSPSRWDADRPKYAEQMKQLQQWLDEAKAGGIKKVFIIFHYPTFAHLGPRPPSLPRITHIK
jgi:hypothetical protein